MKKLSRVSGIMHKNSWSFGKIVFAERLRKSFLLQHQFRKFSSHEQIYEYIKFNKEIVKEYGQPAFLEALNEMPPTYQYGSYSDTPLQVFLLALELPSRNYYDDQLRYSALKRLYECAAQERPQIIKMTYKLLDQIQQKMINTGVKLELIESINWVVITKISDHPLILQAFRVLDQKFEIFKQRMNALKAIVIILKRLLNFSWNDGRHYNNILEHFCFKEFYVSISKTREEMTVFEETSNINFYALRYRILPIGIRSLCDNWLINDQGFMAEETLFDSVRIFKAFNLFPLDFNRRCFLRLYDYLIKNMRRILPNLLVLPYLVMTGREIERFQRTLLDIIGPNIIPLSIYYVNSLERMKIYTQIVKERTQKQFWLLTDSQDFTNKAMFQIYIGVLMILLQINKGDPDTFQQFKLVADHIFNGFFSEFDDIDLIRTLSFANLFNYMHISILTGHEFEDETFKFFHRRIESDKFATKSDNLKMQIQEAVSIHKSSPYHQIREILSNQIHLAVNSEMITKDGAVELMFHLFDSDQVEEYEENIMQILDSLKDWQRDTFIEIYARVNFKSRRIQQQVFIILCAWPGDFNSIIYFFCSGPVQYYADQSGSLPQNIVAQIEANTEFLSILDFEHFNVVLAHDLLRFLRRYLDQIKEFAFKSTMILVFQLETNFSSLVKYFTDLEVISCVHEAWRIAQQMQPRKRQAMKSKIRKILKSVQGMSVPSLPTRVRQLELSIYLNQNQMILTETEVEVELILESLMDCCYDDKYISSMVILLKLYVLQLINIPSNRIWKISNAIVYAIKNNIILFRQVKQIFGEEISNRFWLWRGYSLQKAINPELYFARPYQILSDMINDFTADLQASMDPLSDMYLFDLSLIFCDSKISKNIILKSEIKYSSEVIYILGILEQVWPNEFIPKLIRKLANFTEQFCSCQGNKFPFLQLRLAFFIESAIAIVPDRIKIHLLNYDISTELIAAIKNYEQNQPTLDISLYEHCLRFIFIQIKNTRMSLELYKVLLFVLKEVNYFDPFYPKNSYHSHKFVGDHIQFLMGCTFLLQQYFPLYSTHFPDPSIFQVKQHIQSSSGEQVYKRIKIPFIQRSIHGCSKEGEKGQFRTIRDSKNRFSYEGKQYDPQNTLKTLLNKANPAHLNSFVTALLKAFLINKQEEIITNKKLKIKDNMQKMGFSLSYTAPLKTKEYSQNYFKNGYMFDMYIDSGTEKIGVNILSKKDYVNMLGKNYPVGKVIFKRNIAELLSNVRVVELNESNPDLSFLEAEKK